MEYKELIERLEKGAEWVKNHGRNTNTALGELCKEAAHALSAVTEENTRLRTELELKNNIVERYAASARSISLYLKDFCNRSLPYDEMISDAVRKAETELEQVKRERDAAAADIKEILQQPYTCVCWACKCIDSGLQCREHCKNAEWRGIEEE